MKDRKRVSREKCLTDCGDNFVHGPPVELLVGEDLERELVLVAVPLDRLQAVVAVPGDALVDGQQEQVEAVVISEIKNRDSLSHVTSFRSIMVIFNHEIHSDPLSRDIFNLSLSVFMTCAKTVESFPPDAPMATLSPRLNNLCVTMVWWISVSKAQKKQDLHRARPVLGRWKKEPFR